MKGKTRNILKIATTGEARSGRTPGLLLARRMPCADTATVLLLPPKAKEPVHADGGLAAPQAEREKRSGGECGREKKAENRRLRQQGA